MVASDVLEAVALEPGDAAGGLALSTGAGWNQTADDWAWFIAQGHASGMRSEDGRLVATAAAAVYGDRAWISMVLVDPAWRHRGLASRLMERTVARLQGLGITPVLDATPAGEAVYRQLGFRPGFALERWQGVAGPASNRAAHDARPPAVEVRAATAADLDALVALDRRATGLDRRGLLQSFLARPGTRAWLAAGLAADVIGFVVARTGTRALQIGPLVARDTDTAQALLATALDAFGGPVFLDVPTRWPALAARLEARGFVRQRPFIRMDLGAPQAIACDDRLFVLAGPEFG